jgi:hypothetical protein
LKFHDCSSEEPRHYSGGSAAAKNGAEPVTRRVARRQRKVSGIENSGQVAETLGFQVEKTATLTATKQRKTAAEQRHFDHRTATKMPR